jgi:hypothetical protein
LEIRVDGMMLPAKGALLSTGPGELKSIVLQDNALGGAGKATEELVKDFWQPPQGEENQKPGRH